MHPCAPFETGPFGGKNRCWGERRELNPKKIMSLKLGFELYFTTRITRQAQSRTRVCLIKITFTLLPTNCFVSITSNSMKCLVNWIPLRIRVRSRNTKSHRKFGFHKTLISKGPQRSLKGVGKGLLWLNAESGWATKCRVRVVRANVRIQLNPAYKAFYRIHSCKIEPIVQ